MGIPFIKASHVRCGSLKILFSIAQEVLSVKDTVCRFIKYEKESGEGGKIARLAEAT